MIKSGCRCFTCRHSDEPRIVKAYLVGQIEACEWFLNWAKENKIKMGSIADNDLAGLYAQIQCNHDDACCIAHDLPDLEEE